MIRRFFKSKFFKWIFWLSVCFLIFGWICFSWVERSTKNAQYDVAEKVPSCHAAIVLGTSRYLSTGVQNLYFTYRIDAAEKLYRAGKVEKFILSGDNRVNDYNEPKEMKKALMQRGIPDSCLVLDYAGLRTFDSMVRCKEIFGQDSVIVVSQQFHTARSIFIAKKIGLVAFGFNAQKVTTQRTVRMWIREFFSRIKCVLDLYVFHAKPKHLGDKITI
jgi:SanA protein